MDPFHDIQMQILRELLYHPHAKFSDLNIRDLSNDHFSYHIRIMVESGLVSKDETGYTLTETGKEFANRMDTDTAKIERQPKVSIMLIPEESDVQSNRYLIQTRLKEPYYGYKGFMTGKMRFGETVFETATRELSEEMGLTADFEYRFLLHEMVYNKEGKMLEDKFFHVIKASNLNGELITDVPGGQNNWYSETDFLKLSPVYHNEFEIFVWFKAGNREFKEKKYYIDSF